MFFMLNYPSVFLSGYTAVLNTKLLLKSCDKIETCSQFVYKFTSFNLFLIIVGSRTWSRIKTRSGPPPLSQHIACKVDIYTRPVSFISPTHKECILVKSQMLEDFLFS